MIRFPAVTPATVGRRVWQGACSSAVQHGRAAPNLSSWWPVHSLQPLIQARHIHAAHAASADATTATGPVQLSQDEINERIQANRARKAANLPLPICPACGAAMGTLLNLATHLDICCPDVMDRPAWQQLVSEAPRGAPLPLPLKARMGALLQAAELKEKQQREQALHWAFRSGETDAEGRLLKHKPPELALRMGLSVKRAERLLGSAMRGVPLVADEEPLEVIFEDEYLLAVNKPPGITTAPVHRFKGGSMVSRVLHHLGKEGNAGPHVLHRLDMDTSGVLLFGKRPDVVAAVHRQFRARTVAKMYLCIALGCPDQAAWEVNLPITRHPTNNVARRTLPLPEGPTVTLGRRRVTSSGRRRVTPPSSPVVSGGEVNGHTEDEGPAGEEDEEAQDASTGFFRLGCCDADMATGASRGEVYEQPAVSTGASLVAAAPHSGRTHQIRLHMAATGHPLVGDNLYGLMVLHPITKQPLVMTAPLPADMRAAMALLGLNANGSGGEADMIERAWEALHGQ